MSKGVNLKNNPLLKNFSLEMPRDENILPQTIFTQEYPMVNFFQTTIAFVY